MLKPLEEFVCDTCKEKIKAPTEGTLEWIERFNEETNNYEIGNFRIVHNYSSSPQKDYTRNGCLQHSETKGQSDLPLRLFFENDSKMANILRFLDAGEIHNTNYKGCYVQDMRQYVNMVRRLTIPYYEEGRLFWKQAKADGFFGDLDEVDIYRPEHLIELIKHYNDKL